MTIQTVSRIHYLTQCSCITLFEDVSCFHFNQGTWQFALMLGLWLLYEKQLFVLFVTLFQVVVVEVKICSWFYLQHMFSFLAMLGLWLSCMKNNSWLLCFVFMIWQYLILDCFALCVEINLTSRMSTIWDFLITCPHPSQWVLKIFVPFVMER